MKQLRPLLCLALGLTLLGCADDSELGSGTGGELDDPHEDSIVVEIESELRIHGELTATRVSVEPADAGTFVVSTDRLVFDGAQWGDSRIFVENRNAPRDQSQNDGPTLIPFLLYTRSSEGEWKPLELQGTDHGGNPITSNMFWDAELSPRSNTLEDRYTGELALPSLDGLELGIVPVVDAPSSPDDFEAITHVEVEEGTCFWHDGACKPL